MAQAKGGNGTVVADDLLADVVDDTPPVRKNSAKVPAAFTVNDDLLARIKTSFSRTGALSIKRLFPTAKDARKGTAIYAAHCEIAVQDFEGKSLRTDVIEINDEFASTHDWAATANGQFAVLFSLTHKRERKPKDAPAADAPAADSK